MFVCLVFLIPGLANSVGPADDIFGLLITCGDAVAEFIFRLKSCCIEQILSSEVSNCLWYFAACERAVHIRHACGVVVSC